MRIFCKNHEKHHNILAGLCPLIQSAGRPKKMLIYWKRCECSNGELKHSSIRFSIHPFDHLALMCSSMYAKASCDAPHKQSTQTQTVSVFLSSSFSLPTPPSLTFSHFFLSFCSFKNSCSPLKLRFRCSCGGHV